MSDIGQALRLERHATEIVSRNWFECAGDAVLNSGEAMLHYRVGLLNKRLTGAQPLPFGVVVKYLGTIVLSRHAPDPDVIAAIRHDRRRLETDLANVREKRRTTGLCLLDYVLERAEYGYTELGRLLSQQSLGRFR